jgi:hypothetical protein
MRDATVAMGNLRFHSSASFLGHVQVSTTLHVLARLLAFSISSTFLDINSYPEWYLCQGFSCVGDHHSAVKLQGCMSAKPPGQQVRHHLCLVIQPLLIQMFSRLTIFLDRQAEK